MIKVGDKVKFKGQHETVCLEPGKTYDVIALRKTWPIVITELGFLLSYPPHWFEHLPKPEETRKTEHADQLAKVSANIKEAIAAIHAQRQRHPSEWIEDRPPATS